MGYTEYETTRFGVQRPSMHHNCLLIRADAGQMKRTALSNVSAEHPFGLQRPHDTDDAGIKIRSWAQADRSIKHDSGPDYVRMNKLAARRGLTMSGQQAAFRKVHPIKLKRGIAATSAPPQLPSDADPYHAYGSLPAFRSMELIRMMGADSPSVKSLIQGAYIWDWCLENHGRTEKNAGRLSNVRSRTLHTTRAAQGHAQAAQKRLEAEGKPKEEAFKLKRFKSVGPVVQSFRGL